MNARFRVLVSATALALPVSLPAFAADYDPPIIIDQPVDEVPVEVGSGWYLRGDIGYNFSTEGDGTFTYRTFDPFAGYGAASFDSASLDDGMTWGVGFGYHFTDMIRADFTFDGYRMGFDGATSSAAPCIDPTISPGFAGTGCRSEDSATASVLSFMVNGYVDLGTYVGVTPYVGGGLGYSYVDWSSLNDLTYCVGPTTCPVALVGSSSQSGEQSWRFTYAFMAGLAYDLTQSLKVDLGYRYRHVDGGEMFAFHPATISAGANGTQGEDPGFDTHEVRLGLRYDIW